VNVWVALVHEIHPYHKAATEWSKSLESDAVAYFCRFTQLGLLRLLTNENAMREDVLTQQQAWEAFDVLVADPRNRMMGEPAEIDPAFRQRTGSQQAATKQWADGYLTAFAETAGIQLVTFDRALAAKVNGAVLVG
jgi:toxin-antitoxin system PIN domain toxin